MGCRWRPFHCLRHILVTIACFFTNHVRALQKTIGDPHNGLLQNISRQCGGYEPGAFDAGQCSQVVECVLNKIPQIESAGFNSGTNIAGLVPTILALVGCPPLELVQLALVSPHRALATCMFSIGLPTSLFRQLRPVLPHLGEAHALLPKVREWRCPMPRSSRLGGWAIVGRVIFDAAIFALAAIMMRISITLSLSTIISWKCQFTFLAISWPSLCIIWLLGSCFSLWIMCSKIEIRFSGDNPRGKSRSLWELFALPYRLPAEIRSTLPRHTFSMLRRRTTCGSNAQDSKSNNEAQLPSTRNVSIAEKPLPQPPLQSPYNIPEFLDNDTPSPYYDGPTFSVRIEMPTAHGFRSWAVYESAMETCAVGIYMYATFVLTSTLLLSGETAIQYASIMVFDLCLIRILNALL